MLVEALVDGHAVWVVDARQLDEAVTKRASARVISLSSQTLPSEMSSGRNKDTGADCYFTPSAYGYCAAGGGAPSLGGEA